MKFRALLFIIKPEKDLRGDSFDWGLQASGELRSLCFDHDWLGLVKVTAEAAVPLRLEVGWNREGGREVFFGLQEIF